MHERGALHTAMLHFLFGFGGPVTLQHAVRVFSPLTKKSDLKTEARQRRFRRAVTFLSGKRPSWNTGVIRLLSKRTEVHGRSTSAKLASTPVPSHDWEPLPPSSGADCYVNRPEERMKSWAEEDKGGQTKGRPTQTQEAPLLCGKCFIMAAKAFYCSFLCLSRGPWEFRPPSVQGVVKKYIYIMGHVQTGRIIDLIIICPQDISLPSCSLWVYLKSSSDSVTRS